MKLPQLQASPDAYFPASVDQAWFNKALAQLSEGRVKRARKLVGKQVKHRGKNAAAELIYTLCDEREGKLSAAITHCLRSIDYEPGEVFYRKKLADLYFSCGNYPGAEERYLQVTALEPENHKVLCRLASIYGKQNQYRKQIQILDVLVKKDEQTPQLDRELCLALAKLPVAEFDKEIASVMLKTLNKENVYHDCLSAVLSEYITWQYDLRNSEAQIELGVVACDALFKKALSSLLLINPHMEDFISQLREALLNHVVCGNALSPDWLEFLSALAQQMQKREFAILETRSEINIIANLEDLLEETLNDKDWEPAQSEAILLCLSLYTLLDKLACREKLITFSLKMWPESLRAIAKNGLYDPAAEREIARHIKSIAEVSSAVSQKVKAQYEENPYPRWQKAGYVGSFSVLEYIRINVPEFTAAERFNTHNLRILVAGCGTGKQPIELALMHKNTQICAVDLSRQSLAYAQRKSTEAGIDNIEFFQGDILSLNNWNRRFDLIVCSGVLHHMENPMEGWQILKNLLVEDGILNIALYSQLARQQISRQRASIEALDFTANTQNIKKYRKALMQREPESTILQWADFWTLSDCRDLLFNVQEHQFTWDEIKTCCDALHLEFVGVKTERKIRELFSRHFQEKGAAADPACWAQLESASPHLFRSMYNFWCRPLASPGTT